MEKKDEKEKGKKWDKFAWIWMGRPEQVGNELSPEEVVWMVEYSDPDMETEEVISRLGCGMAEINFRYGGQIIPLTLSFYEREDGELQIYFRLGNCIEFNAEIMNPHTGKRGIEALVPELGKEAILRHLERQREYRKRLDEAREKAGGTLIF